MVAALLVPSVALAVDPTVTITVSAKTIAITNSQATWAIGPVEIDDVGWFNVNSTTENQT